MFFERIVEALIKEVVERGEFENLPGQAKLIDLTGYLATPEEARLANPSISSAGAENTGNGEGASAKTDRIQPGVPKPPAAAEVRLR